MLAWLEKHEELAGWAQFFGAMLALAVTYFTAFAPTWRRKRQLRNAAERMMANGLEVIESYHRTSAHFAPFPLSVRAASMSMTAVVDEIGRFPTFELDDQGSNSLARRLTAMSHTVSATRFFLDAFAANLEGRTATQEEHDSLRAFVGDRLKVAADLVSGKALKRPEWPDPVST